VPLFQKCGTPFLTAGQSSSYDPSNPRFNARSFCPKLARPLRRAFLDLPAAAPLAMPMTGVGTRAACYSFTAANIYSVQKVSDGGYRVRVTHPDRKLARRCRLSL
jgi:hypothetical protein